MTRSGFRGEYPVISKPGGARRLIIGRHGDDGFMPLQASRGRARQGEHTPHTKAPLSKPCGYKPATTRPVENRRAAIKAPMPPRPMQAIFRISTDHCSTLNTVAIM